jgi:uncharacterized iron-regulated membrane protein
MKTKTIWKLHSWLGLLAGIPLLVIALTGSLLVFKDEINAWLIPEKVLVEPQSAELPLEQRLDALQNGLPRHEVTGWAFYNEPERADFVFVMERGDNVWLHVYQNPYTGEILSEPATTTSELMGWILELHYTFLAGHIGTAVCGILAILLCLLGVTGFFIYRKFWKNFFSFRWRSSWRLLSGNLHKRIGVVSAPVFLILGLTGAFWNLDHILHELEHLAEEEHDPMMKERLYATDIPLDAMVAKSRETMDDFRVRYISFPWEKGLGITFWGELEGQSPLRSPYNSTVAFEAEQGEAQGHTRITEASLWTQIYDAFTPLHFGTFGGWISRTIWCVLGAAPGALALSGCFIWYKRR